MKIYHNTRCTKSRASFQLLQESGFEFQVIEYLKEPLSKKEIKVLLAQLDIPAEEAIRKGEAIFKEHFKGKLLSEAKWIDAIVKYPILLERPIISNGNKAVIGRPVEKVVEFLELND